MRFFRKHITLSLLPLLFAVLTASIGMPAWEHTCAMMDKTEVVLGKVMTPETDCCAKETAENTEFSCEEGSTNTETDSAPEDEPCCHEEVRYYTLDLLAFSLKKYIFLAVSLFCLPTNFIFEVSTPSPYFLFFENTHLLHFKPPKLRQFSSILWGVFLI